MKNIIIYCLCSLVLAGCAGLEQISSHTQQIEQGKNLEFQPLEYAIGLPNFDSNFSVAVTWIYDEHSGYVTALSDHFRDQAELALHQRGHTVKARKDLGLVTDEIFSFGTKEGVDISEAYEGGRADIVVGGVYSVVNDKQKQDPVARLVLKAYHLDNGSLVDGLEQTIPLPPGWGLLAAQNRKNVFQTQLNVLKDQSQDVGPQLAANLDRLPACYKPEESGRIEVHTEPGSYLYLLNLSADHTVALLYPNSMVPEAPLATGDFVFPPKTLSDQLELVFYPLDGNTSSQEFVKVISSKTPLDFSFLPVPVDTIYVGAEGGDIEEVTNMLKKNHGWSEIVLPYIIGNECAQ